LPWTFRKYAAIESRGKIVVVACSQHGPQPCDSIRMRLRFRLLRDWLQPVIEQFVPSEVGLQFNPARLACLGVNHLLLEQVLQPEGLGDCRGSEHTVKSVLNDKSLDGVADSPVVGIAERVAAGAGLPR
jgi:hypothetical protein